MKYILAVKETALGAGFRDITHRSNEKYMLLNENEVRICPSLTGTLEERATQLGGRWLTTAQTFLLTKKKGEYRI